MNRKYTREERLELQGELVWSTDLEREVRILEIYDCGNIAVIENGIGLEEIDMEQIEKLMEY